LNGHAVFGRAINRANKVVHRIEQQDNGSLKRLAVHGAFLTLIAGIVLQGKASAGIDHSSLLYTLISGEEVAEGPLDPSAYAQTYSPGVGGARLAAADAGLSVDIITFDDPEVEFAATLGGTAVTGPLSPIVPEPGSSTVQPTKKSRVYAVQENETITSIAAKFDISENTVLWANGLSSKSIIQVGDHLTILPTTGVLHSVKSGDTISGIAEEYDVSSNEIIEFNGLEDAHKLSLGQKIIVPDGYINPAANISTPTTSGSAVADGPAPESVKVAGTGLLWPTTTRHISQYFRWGHTGIDIDNRSRPAIYAAESGTVEFAGWLGGYGNMVIINHGGGLQTYYAHNSKHYVGKGEKVAKGQAIAQMGSTGRSTGPHVHFEVRQNGRPINPLGMY
jgi:murein DD-endopeptidase MepM/ murein hydrolase activator NlpD